MSCNGVLSLIKDKLYATVVGMIDSHTNHLKTPVCNKKLQTHSQEFERMCRMWSHAVVMPLITDIGIPCKKIKVRYRIRDESKVQDPLWPMDEDQLMDYICDPKNNPKCMLVYPVYIFIMNNPSIPELVVSPCVPVRITG